MHYNIPNRNLKSARIKFGDTQQDLAKYLAITINTLNLKENGKYKFTLDEALMISKRYNKTIEEIFFDDLDVATTT